MRAGITRQALRRHRWSLLGPAVTQALAAAVIAAMVTTAQSIDASPLTPAERRALATAGVSDMTAVFIGIAVYLTTFIVGVTMHLALRQQLPDIALLRTVGATPGQVRRHAARQAAIVAVPSTLAGCALAIPAAALWVAALRAHGVVPDAVRFRPALVAVPIALAVEVVTSVVAGYLASIRTSRRPPAASLADPGSGRRPVGRLRVALGATAMAAGVVLAAILSRVSPDQADDATFFVMLSECVGAGLLAPLVLRAVARRLRPMLGTGVPRLAIDDLETMSRSLSGALIPLVLAAAFATVKVAVHTTAARVTGIPDPAADRWVDYSGTAIYAAFAGIAALNCLLTVVAGRRHDLATLRLAGATRGDLVRMAWCQTAVVTAAALVLAVVVSSATLAPILHTSLDRWVPYLPLPAAAAGVGLVAAVVAAGLVAPIAVLARTPPAAEAWSA